MSDATIRNMSVEAFRSLPHRARFDSDEGMFTGLVIVPGRAVDMHSSGYRAMTLVGVRWMRPVCIVSACSDSLEFTGDVQMDCLPVSGCLQAFPRKGGFVFGPALSSFRIQVVAMSDCLLRQMVPA